MSRRAGWLIGQLPVGMLDDDFFYRFASMFEEEAGTLVAGADNLPFVVDPTVAPTEMVGYLGSWLGGPRIDSSIDEQQQRRLVRAVGRSMAWRGTRRGLETWLATVTGGEARVSENGSIRRDDGRPAPAPTVRVEVGTTGWLPADQFVALVADEVPVNVHLEVWVDGQQVHPPAPDGPDAGGGPAGAVPTLAGSAPGGWPGAAGSTLPGADGSTLPGAGADAGTLAGGSTLPGAGADAGTPTGGSTVPGVGVDAGTPTGADVTLAGGSADPSTLTGGWGAPAGVEPPPSPRAPMAAGDPDPATPPGALRDNGAAGAGEGHPGDPEGSGPGAEDGGGTSS